MRVYIAADNIITPLGVTTEENLLAITCYRSALREYQEAFGYQEPSTLSLLDKEFFTSLFGERTGVKEPKQWSLFEQICILSIIDSNREKQYDLSSDKTLFILSSTKGNIGFIEKNPYEDPLLYTSAKRICGAFNNNNNPIVISNACISGAAAISVGKRYLLSGRYDTVVITGADTVSQFIYSGFNSLKALSQEPCRPFDIERKGLNLGEAAGTIVLRADSQKSDLDLSGKVSVEANSITNDANHISGPSRTAEGLYRAITSVMKGVDSAEIGAVNLHGTATIYNDQMESIALERAGLNLISSYSLKGIFGHTLGAAGVIETIISCAAMQRGFIPHSNGYCESGVTAPMDLSPVIRKSQYNQIIKTASGFGGCNVALRLKKN